MPVLQNMRYALMAAVHFKCVRCSNTHCLDELPFPGFKAPAGYSFITTNILIQGICKECGKEV